MFRSLHTSLSVVHIKSTVNIQMIKGLLKCYSIVKNTFKNFFLTIFMAVNTNILNKTIPPLRPIVSSVDTYNYKLAQYLGSLLSPHIP